MNDLHKLARIILVGLGIYVLIRHTIGVIAALPYLFYGESPLRGLAVGQLVSFALFAVCSGLVVYALIWKADFLSAKITGIYESDQAEVWWLPFAFRLASVCAGILLLSWSISSLTSIIATYVRMADPRFANRPMPWERLVGGIIQLPLAIYLVCGAPHFVNWQVRKTLEHCGQWEEPDDIYGEEE
ncbi:MAG TPA: hypothetical protein VJJ98_09865 [Sedimentisphaerales bacterium]|nr:hypothetical protein [Sedimentisphaerales bacterium]